jgi:hypothetical protein
MRQLLSAICLALAVGACTSPASQPSASASPSSLDATGILLVGVGEQVQAAPSTDALRAAFGQAIALVQANPDDLGYPWIDPLDGDLVVSAATPRGRALLEATNIPVPHRIRDAAHSAAELQQIQDEATFLQSQGVPDADLIFKTIPDQRDDRALIVVHAMSRPLLEALAGRFPVDALAVEVDPTPASAGT